MSDATSLPADGPLNPKLIHGRTTEPGPPSETSTSAPAAPKESRAPVTAASSSGTPRSTRKTPLWRKLLTPLASLKLTVGLFVVSMILIYVGTVAQVEEGLWPVLDKYFRSWMVMVPVDLLFTEVFFPPVEIPRNIAFPMPAGKLLGTLVLINLLAAHGVRFKMNAKVKANPRRLVAGLIWLMIGIAAVCAAFLAPPITNWLAENLVLLFAVGSLFFLPLVVGCWLLFGKRLGIVLVHASLILLIAGEGITGWQAREVQVPVYEGADQAIAWGHDVRKAELAIYLGREQASDEGQAAAGNQERVMIVSEDALRRASDDQTAIALPDTGLKVFVTEIPVPNAEPGMMSAVNLRFVDDATDAELIRSTASVFLGPELVHNEQFSHRFQRQSVPAATGQSAGVDYALRFQRSALPFKVELNEFQHELYPGTDVPRHYGSDVTITDLRTGVTRHAQIAMNDPLRYSGYTLFQASWLPNDSGTVLQVVRNPGWTIPYIACIVGGIGLLIHFMISLWTFLRKERKRRPAGLETKSSPREQWGVRIAAIGCAIIFGGYLLSGLGRATAKETIDGFNVGEFGRLIVADGGRFKPLDSLARDTLLTTLNRESVDLTPPNLGLYDRMRQKETKPAIVWLLDAATGQDQDIDPVIRIDDRDVKDLIGVSDYSLKRFSLQQIVDHLDVLIPEFESADQVASDDRNSNQRALIDLSQRINTISSIVQLSGPHMIPPQNAAAMNQDSDEETLGTWRALPEVEADDPIRNLYVTALSAYRNQDAATFNAAVDELLLNQRQQFPSLDRRHGTYETIMNAWAPHQKAIALYLIAGFFVLMSWLIAPRPMMTAATTIMVLAVLVHTTALLLRIYVSGRPPVTNLYSSAVFIGWGAVLFSLPMERLLRDGISIMVGVISGIATLLIADGLDTGDNMAVLQAVLDTNFWLATHVITISLGYTATYLAGLFGAAYIISGIFTNRLRGSRRLEGAIYGVTCFALLLSFVGTILGGIWADQSWGRFWGWDPKENGAMLIVIWCALILHARWGGMIRGRGIAVLAVLGGIVTSWSWFGVNMLGTGLHAYGFIDQAPQWLRAYVFVQLLLVALASLPLSEWRSFKAVGESKKLESKK